MKLPVYELKINESLADDSEVSYVALVDEPAIQKDFLAFKNEFVEPAKGESEEEYIGRCVKVLIDEGTDQEQALAICYSKWQTKFAEDSYTDYPEAAVDNAKTALRYAEENGWGDCGESTGKLRANQLAIEKLKQIDKEGMSFQIMDEDKRIISGPLMLADELIYRNNDKFGEHYVKFSAETIKAIAIKFAKRKYQANVNLMHDPDQKVKDVTMFESWIVDKERGILPMKGFEDVANGSWFGSFYVENDEVWKQVKAGEYRGFSVEGLFDYEEPKSYEEQMLEKIKNLLYS